MQVISIITFYVLKKEISMKLLQLWKIYPKNYFSNSGLYIEINKEQQKSTVKKQCRKILDVKVDNTLNFKIYIDGMCKKAEQRLNALCGMTSYIGFSIKYTLVNAFFIPI